MVFYGVWASTSPPSTLIRRVHTHWDYLEVSMQAQNNNQKNEPDKTLVYLIHGNTGHTLFDQTNLAHHHDLCNFWPFESLALKSCCLTLKWVLMIFWVNSFFHHTSLTIEWYARQRASSAVYPAFKAQTSRRNARNSKNLNNLNFSSSRKYNALMSNVSIDKFD